MRQHTRGTSSDECRSRSFSGDEGTKVPVPLGDATAIMAYADVRITAGIYARPSKENLTKALERIAGQDD